MIGGVGELDLERNGRATTVRMTPELSPPRWAERPYPDCPYLLLDMRERDQYDQCHIISGRRRPIRGRPCLKGWGPTLTPGAEPESICRSYISPPPTCDVISL